jgi:hypothetical protein
MKLIEKMILTRDGEMTPERVSKKVEKAMKLLEVAQTNTDLEIIDAEERVALAEIEYAKEPNDETLSEVVSAALDREESQRQRDCISALLQKYDTEVK